MNKILTLNPFFLSSRQSRKAKFSILKFIRTFSFFLLTGLICLYIFQVNESTKEIYYVQNYESKLKKLLQENKDSEISFSRLNSLVDIETKIGDMNLEKITQIKYIQVLDGQVVKTTFKIDESQTH